MTIGTLVQWIVIIIFGTCVIGVACEYFSPRMGKYSPRFRSLPPHVKEVLVGAGEDRFPPIEIDKATDSKHLMLTQQYTICVHTKGWFDRHTVPQVIIRRIDGVITSPFTKQEQELIYHMVTRAYRIQEEYRKREHDRIIEQERIDDRRELEDNLPQ